MKTIFVITQGGSEWNPSGDVLNGPKVLAHGFVSPSPSPSLFLKGLGSDSWAVHHGWMCLRSPWFTLLRTFANVPFHGWWQLVCWETRFQPPDTDHRDLGAPEAIWVRQTVRSFPTCCFRIRCLICRCLSWQEVILAWNLGLSGQPGGISIACL